MREEREKKDRVWCDVQEWDDMTMVGDGLLCFPSRHRGSRGGVHDGQRMSSNGLFSPDPGVYVSNSV